MISTGAFQKKQKEIMISTGALVNKQRGSMFLTGALQIKTKKNQDLDRGACFHNGV